MMCKQDVVWGGFTMARVASVSRFRRKEAVDSLRFENPTLDDVDARLLEALAADGRTKVAALARQVGLSAPSVAERIRRLEATGVIQGYTVRVDPRALGLPLAAWLRIRPIPGQMQRVADILRSLPEIVECDRITGEDCFIARAHVRTVEHLEALIDRLISHAMTNTSLIQSSPVPRRLPPIARREEVAHPPTRAAAKSPRKR
jgi:Lrp/AsnC family leucine-responsive transcriptional regulator